MRIRALVQCLAVSLSVVSPIGLHAQFQQPTKEELEMTSDPKTPGAAAVYLNLEEITNDPLHYHSFYARIKVLGEKGKSLATVELPYSRGNFKIDDIKGRTILPDGTVIPLSGKPEDLLISKGANRELARKVFTLPNVQVGSILEYRYQVRYEDNHFSSPSWQIQRDYFIHNAHYAFTPFKAFLKGPQNATSMFLVDSRGRTVNSLIWWSSLPAGTDVKADSIGRYSLDVTDIPATPSEDWMPPIESLTYQVIFYYKSAFDGADFWTAEAKDWSKRVDHFAEPTGPIRQAVSTIVKPTDSDLDKAKKLYDAVQALDNTDFSRRKSKAELQQLGVKQAKRAEDTWSQKSGTAEDIALLYLALLRAAGLTAYDMKVVDRSRDTFQGGHLDFDQLDDDVIILKLDGKETVLDPGEKMCPFKVVHWRHSGAGGIREGAEGRAAAVTPQQMYSTNVTLRTGDVNLDEHGSITGDFRFVMSGQDALYWRQQAFSTISMRSRMRSIAISAKSSPKASKPT